MYAVNRLQLPKRGAVFLVLYSVDETADYEVFFLSRCVVCLFTLSYSNSVTFSTGVASIKRGAFVVLVGGTSPQGNPMNRTFLLSFVSRVRYSRLLRVRVLVGRSTISYFRIRYGFTFHFRLSNRRVFEAFRRLFISRVSRDEVRHLLATNVRTIMYRIFRHARIYQFSTSGIVVLLIMERYRARDISDFSAIAFSDSFSYFTNIMHLFQDKGRSHSNCAIHA